MKIIYNLLTLLCYSIEESCRKLTRIFMCKGNYYNFKSRGMSFKKGDNEKEK